MTIIGLKRAVEEIRLDESPDSPVYRLDLTDIGIAEKAAKLRANVRRYQDLQARLEAGVADEADMDALLEELAGVYEVLISLMLGHEAYEEIVAYAANGADIEAKDMNIVLTPLVLYLYEKYNEVLTANNNAAIAKYGRKRVAAAAL